MSLKTHSIKYNFLMDFILKVSALIFPIITFPYVSRILSPQGLGSVSFATGIISYFQMFAALGIPTQAVRVCSKYRDDKQKLSKAFQELTILYTITTVISYIVFFVCLFLVPAFKEQKLLFLISSANVLLHLMGFSWLYTALEQYQYITVRSMIMKVLSIIALFAFIHEKDDYVIYALISVLSSTGSNLFNFFYSRKFVSWRPIGNYNLKQHIKPILTLFAMSIAGSIYTQLDTVMLGFMHTSHEVGIYTTAVKMKNLLLGLTVALGGVMLPRLSYYVQNKKFDLFKSLSSRAFNIVLYITLPICVYFSIFARESILFLGGEQYSASVISMQIIMPTVMFISLTNMMGYQILIPTNRENKVLISVIAGSVVNFIINGLCIPKYGSLGAAFGTLIAELCVLIVQAIYLKDFFKEIRKDLTIKYVFLPLLAALAVSIPLKMLFHSAPIIELMVSAVLFFGAYAGVFLLEKEPFVMSQLNGILKSFKQKLSR